ncbi:MAG: nuclear transport factor 2 family protein [Gemmatimonadales bacterium]
MPWFRAGPPCAVTAAGLVVLAGCAGAPPPPSPAPPAAGQPALEAAQELIQLEDAWARALSERDTAFFQRTLGDEFVETGGEGARTKPEVIAHLSRSTDSVPLPRFEQTTVRLFGDVAVVTGVAAYSAGEGGFSSRIRFSEVWVKRDRRWQAVHGHYNPIPPASTR